MSIAAAAIASPVVAGDLVAVAARRGRCARVLSPDPGSLVTGRWSSCAGDRGALVVVGEFEVVALVAGEHSISAW